MIVVTRRLLRDGVEHVELADRLQLRSQIGEHEAHQVLGVRALLLRGHPFVLCDALRTNDAAQAREAHRREHHGCRRRDDHRGPMAPQPAAHELRRRVVVRADELTGLELAKVVGKLARARVAIGGRPCHRLVDDREQITRHAGLDRGE